MLQSLPQDVLTMIVKQLANRADLKNICEVSKTLYLVSLPFLYQSISLQSDELDVDEVDVEPLRLACDRGYLTYVRDIRITSTFEEGIIDRCPHHRYKGNPLMQKKETRRITHILTPLLERLKDGKLQSLSWILGTCLPESLFGPSGYFPLRQPNIESLHFVTDRYCSWPDDTRVQLALTSFPHLKRLRWVGLRSSQQMKALSTALELISHQIVELELDLGYPSDLDDYSEIEHYEDIIGSSILGSGMCKFTALRILSLSQVTLLSTQQQTSSPSETSDTSDTSDSPVIGHPFYERKRQVERISNTFDFSTIWSLKLRLCPGWEDLLDILTTYPRPMSIKSLEIQSPLFNEFGEGHGIIEFLQSFEGLENFYLSTGSTPPAFAVWRAVSHHKATLRRFVHHQRWIDPNEDFPLVEMEADVSDLSLDATELAGFRIDPSQNPLNELELTSLGLCCSPVTMKSIVSAFVGKGSLEILHMRQSGADFEHTPKWSRYAPEDDGFAEAKLDLPNEQTPGRVGKSFQEFAQWVFGPTGILSLRLLAYGDFSCDERFASDNLLLCRTERPPQVVSSDMQSLNFRSISVDDKELWELYEKNADLLGACPVDSIFDG